jgi:O-antigen/teichoic acid export membrane protein
MAHKFTPVQFSAWALFVVIISIFESIKTGLLRNPAIKFLSLPQYEGREPAVRSASFFINVLFSLTVVVLILMNGGWISKLLKTPELRSLLNGGTWIILLNIFFSQYEMILQSNFQFNKILIANITRQSFFLGGVVILSFYPAYFTLFNVLLFQIAGYIAGTIVITFACRKYINTKLLFDLKIIQHMLHFGKYTFGNNVFAQLGRTLDHTLTAFLLDPVIARNYVAYYNVVNRVNNMLDVPSLATADVAFPKNVSSLQETGLEKVTYQFERVAASILAIMIPLSILILVFPKQVLFIIGGKDYFPAALILQLSMLFGWVRPLSYQFSSVMDAIGKPQVNFYMNLGFLVISLFLHYGMIKLTGGMGAAIAQSILNLMMIWFMSQYLRKYLGTRNRSIIQYVWITYRDGWSIVSKKLKGRA